MQLFMASDSESTSNSMLAEACRGDQASWTKLIDLYQPLVVKELRKILYRFTDTDADDIAQNVFLVLFHRISSFKSLGNGSFRAYLREIARRQALAWIRRRGPEQLPSDYTEAETQSALREWSDPWSQLNLTFDAEHEQYWKDKILEETHRRCQASSKLKRSFELFTAAAIDGKQVRDAAIEIGISLAAGYRAMHEVREVINQIRTEWADFL